MTDLHRAASSQTRHLAIARAYTEGRSLDERNERGMTPLHHGIPISTTLTPASAYLLLALGAEPDIADGEGVRPLHRACQAGMQELIELLLAVGADAHTPDAQGRTPRQQRPSPQRVAVAPAAQPSPHAALRQQNPANSSGSCHPECHESQSSPC